MAQDKSVFGVYRRRDDAKSAMSALENSGFSLCDISVLAAETLENSEVATDKGTKAPEGAAVGAGSGAAVGGALGWLVGVGAAAIPGIGPVLAAGPILAALAGVGVGCAFGGFAGALVGTGISEYHAERYEGRLLAGGILVAVRCRNSGELHRARHLIEVTGAEDISATRENSDDERGASTAA
ncbi:MAG TPA: DUF3341 domain-containing protein [Candidatus Binatia bacterium]|nr:DUF3341 domain-containing protein [Candidatus Binatia bacterium]